MEENADAEHRVMIEQGFSHSMEIDPKRARFPCCIVWSPLPVISWLIPFIGHIGICREDGVILDFAGPNFICVDNFAFGAATRYIQMKKDKCFRSSYPSTVNDGDHYMHEESGKDPVTWDDALRKSTQEYQHYSYNLFTCNCHSFVANNLNRLGFQYGGWNVVNVAALMVFKGSWVSKAAMLRSLLPFFIVSGLGLVFGGTTFLTFWAFFSFLLVGWFLLGTYSFKNFIQL